jgi:hypothetical protein
MIMRRLDSGAHANNQSERQKKEGQKRKYSGTVLDILTEKGSGA